MRIHLCLYPTILLPFHLTSAARNLESVLLSKVKTLTLRKDLRTSHNRVPAVPQLKCVGGNAKGLYNVEIMRCKNQGSDYDDENIQWTCSASLPPEFKLGSTDVICEGFSSPSDPYVLKGSCGVEYRLVLTNAGEEKYGRKGEDLWRYYRDKNYVNWSAIIFWGIFIFVVGWMMYSAFIKDHLNRPTRGGTNNPWGGGGGGGGDGGGGGGGGRPNYDDPPPPYDYPYSTSKPSRTPRQSTWQPGFWTGAGLGSAAGYLAGSRGSSRSAGNQERWGFNQPGAGGWHADNGEGSSSGGRQSGSSGSSSFSGSRYESSGFGSTSRR